jgi:hypothetical protein
MEMTWRTYILFGGTLAAVLCVIYYLMQASAPDDPAEYLYGNTFPEAICPHCQTKGTVRMKPGLVKAGISGAKATGAILTGGVSLLATGLSRKENVTQAHCVNCGVTWQI